VQEKVMVIIPNQSLYLNTLHTISLMQDDRA